MPSAGSLILDEAPRRPGTIGRGVRSAAKGCRGLTRRAPVTPSQYPSAGRPAD